MPDLLVCITFDYDNVSSTISRGGLTPTLLSRCGVGLTGAERLLDLLGAERVPSTCFIPGHTIESYPASVAAIRDAGCEIEHHGWTHAYPRPSRARKRTRNSNVASTPSSASPAANRSAIAPPPGSQPPTPSILLLQHGFAFDSSLMGGDTLPYQSAPGRQGGWSLLSPMVFGPDTKLVEMPIHWSLDDFPHFRIHPLRRRHPARQRRRVPRARQLARRVRLG